MYSEHIYGQGFQVLKHLLLMLQAKTVNHMHELINLGLEVFKRCAIYWEKFGIQSWWRLKSQTKTQKGTGFHWHGSYRKTWNQFSKTENTSHHAYMENNQHKSSTISAGQRTILYDSNALLNIFINFYFLKLTARLHKTKKF